MTSEIGRGRGRSGGFTLLELCMAISILGLIASLSWPALRDFSYRITVRARAEEILQRLCTAREEAILSGKAQTVIVSDEDAVFASAPSASFFPDGSAQFFRLELYGERTPMVRIVVEESGRIEVDDVDRKTA